MRHLSNSQYYKEEAGVGDATKQFDFVEATIAHLFRFAHPALGGKSYGAKFCNKLIDSGLIDNERILEVGGGLGIFAREFLLEGTKHNKNFAYELLDISPNLLNKQKEILREFEVNFLLGNGQILPFADGEFKGTIISNEVIADLDAVELNYEEWLSSEDKIVAKLREIVKETDTFEKIIINTGALEFVKEIARILSPGCWAILTEHGLDNESRIARTGRIDQEVHLEFSINFSHIRVFAESLGLKFEIGNLIDFLEFDKELEVANLNDAQALNDSDPEWPIWAIPAIDITKKYQCSIKDLRETAGLKLPKVGYDGFPDDHTMAFAHSFKVVVLKKD